jgi:hypothetical protein
MKVLGSPRFCHLLSPDLSFTGIRHSIHLIKSPGSFVSGVNNSMRCNVEVLLALALPSRMFRKLKLKRKNERDPITADVNVYCLAGSKLHMNITKSDWFSGRIWFNELRNSLRAGSMIPM